MTKHVNETLYPCVCCGYCTIPGDSSYEICKVCWWEEENYDFPDDKPSYGNEELTLIQARRNYLLYGIYNPEREDLRKLQVAPTEYKQGRVFVLRSDGSVEERLPLEK